MYRAIAIDLAKYIVNKCTIENTPISNLQLQKILFYIQKEFLQTKHTPAFYDDIEAWQFGPVVPNVYYHFCGFGAMPIEAKYDNIIINDIEDEKLINKIVKDKRRLNPWELVEQTHKKGGAWDQVYKNGLGNREVISVELIEREDR